MADNGREVPWLDLPATERARRIGSSLLSFLFKLARLLYVAFSLSVLALTLKYRGPEYKDSVEAEAMLLMALSFPSGFAIIVLFVGVGVCWRHVFGSDLPAPSEIVFIWGSWAAFTVVGYCQWFVVLPMLYRKVVFWFTTKEQK